MAHSFLPTKIFAIDTNEPWGEIVRQCYSFAALATWISVANKVDVSNTGVYVEILGFRKSRFQLPAPTDLLEADCQAVLALRDWAFTDNSPDRLLALRQVVSLHHSAEMFAQATNIRDSAEIIYVGLRSDAVAEAVKSSREAQSYALDTARQSLKSSQDLIKSALERFLATLIAIGGVIIANANRSLSDNISRNLVVIVIIFLTILAVVFFSFEGVLLSLPLKKLGSDLRKSGNSLLNEEQLHVIENLPLITATRQRLRWIKILIPASYATLALLLFFFGYPSYYK